jgi:hypothetical protein
MILNRQILERALKDMPKVDDAALQAASEDLSRLGFSPDALRAALARLPDLSQALRAARAGIPDLREAMEAARASFSSPLTQAKTTSSEAPLDGTKSDAPTEAAESATLEAKPESMAATVGSEKVAPIKVRVASPRVVLPESNLGVATGTEKVKYHRVADLVSLFRVSRNTIIRRFAKEPDVLQWDSTTETVGKRRQAMWLIPDSAVLRVQERLGHNRLKTEAPRRNPRGVIKLRDLH